MRSLAFVALLFLAGCVGDDRATIAGNGQMTGTEEKHLDCGESAHVAVGINGQGTVTVTVSDGGGVQQYRESFAGNGQVGEEQTLRGTSGDWTLRVSFSGELFGGFNGQYSAVLSC